MVNCIDRADTRRIGQIYGGAFIFIILITWTAFIIAMTKYPGAEDAKCEVQNNKMTEPWAVV